jgi:hypothetical protein
MRRNPLLRLVFNLLLTLLLAPSFALAQVHYDLLLKGGHGVTTVVDAGLGSERNY